MKAGEVSIINRELQRLLSEISHKIDRKKYKKVTNHLENEYKVVQSSLWNLSWKNNVESEQVALAQRLLIQHILRNEKLEDSQHFQNRLASY